MKILVVLAALAVVTVAAVSACSSSSNSGGGTGPACYKTAAAPGTSDCTSVARFPGEQFPGYTVTPTASKGPGNAACQGMLGGEYPATVTGPTGNSEDTECTFPGFSPAP
jgi:hypothetical protein